VNYPLVSVLTPSYNQAAWLPHNLVSVASQTHARVEHIVIDGGSTDGTVELLEGLDNRVRWRSEPDRGQSHALNKAFGESRGEIIGWLNSDDAYFGPTAIAEAADVFARYPSVAVVYGHAVLVNADNLVLHAMWVPRFKRDLLSRFNYIIQPAAFVRRSALGETLADERYGSAMDRELWLRLARRHAFVRVDRILAVDRHQPDRKIYTRPDLARADLELLVEEYGVQAGGLTAARNKITSIRHRIAGVTLVGEAQGAGMAFAGVRDGVVVGAVRQTLIPRRWMPMGLAGR
jgi:glycosyltransferase involved in cell wall biosynthesis